MKSRAFTDSPLFYSGQLIGSVLCFFFLLLPPLSVLSVPMFFTKTAACTWKLGVSWKVGCPGTDSPSVCFCLCTFMCALVNTSRTVKVSSFPLCRPFDGMKESGVRGGAVYIFSSAAQVEGRSYGNWHPSGWAAYLEENPSGQTVALLLFAL